MGNIAENWTANALCGKWDTIVLPGVHLLQCGDKKGQYVFIGIQNTTQQLSLCEVVVAGSPAMPTTAPTAAPSAASTTVPTGSPASSTRTPSGTPTQVPTVIEDTPFPTGSPTFTVSPTFPQLEIVQYSPPKNATNVSPDAVITLTFDRAVQAGQGVITFTAQHNSNQTILVPGPHATITGATLVIKPKNDLSTIEESYIVTVSPGCILDSCCRNPYKGLTFGMYQFHTTSVIYCLTTLDSTVAAFKASQVQFVEALASFVKIQPSQVSINSVHPGSVHVVSSVKFDHVAGTTMATVNASLHALSDGSLVGGGVVLSGFMVMEVRTAYHMGNLVLPPPAPFPEVYPPNLQEAKDEATIVSAVTATSVGVVLGGTVGSAVAGSATAASTASVTGVATSSASGGVGAGTQGTWKSFSGMLGLISQVQFMNVVCQGDTGAPLETAVLGENLAWVNLQLNPPWLRETIRDHTTNPSRRLSLQRRVQGVGDISMKLDRGGRRLLDDGGGDGGDDGTSGAHLAGGTDKVSHPCWYLLLSKVLSISRAYSHSTRYRYLHHVLAACASSMVSATMPPCHHATM